MIHEFRSRNELEIDPGIGPAVKSNPSEAVDIPRQAKLRLCYISNPNIIHTRRWVGWFAKRGHTVCLLADLPPKETWPEIPIIDLSKFFHAPMIRFPVWAVWLRRFLRQWRPDVLHAHRVNSAGWLAAASGFHPYVVTPWGSDIFIGPQRSWVERLLARYTLVNADQITAISHAMSDRLVQLGARSDHLIHINHGVNLELFFPGSLDEASSNVLRDRLMISDSARLVFSPRAVHPIYNLDIIVKTIPLVREKIPEVCFIFNTYNTDPNYKKELDQLIISYGLEKSTRWLPATAEPSEMADRYRLSDVVISVPSSDGGTPLTVLEAMACGRPVVCSDLPALREFINHGENGLLVPVGQVAPLAEAIIELIEKPELAAEFGRRGRQVVVERANQDVEMQRMESIYYRLTYSRRG